MLETAFVNILELFVLLKFTFLTIIILLEALSISVITCDPVDICVVVSCTFLGFFAMSLCSSEFH